MKKPFAYKVKMTIAMLCLITLLSSCVSVTNQTVFVNTSEESGPVINQSQANLWLGSNGGALYVYPVNNSVQLGDYSRHLYRLSPGELTKVGKMSPPGETSLNVTTLAGQIENKLYYFSTADHMCSLYMIDLDTGESEIVWSGQQSISREDIHIDGNELWLRLFDYGIQGDYLLIKDGKADVMSNESKTYLLGLKEYALDYEKGQDPKVLVREGDSDWQDTGLNCGNKCALIPTKYGLVVHCSGYSRGGKQHLYLIQPSGDTIELLSFPCLYSVSAINIFDDMLYYSVKRYEKYGEIGMTRYKDDEVEGLYMISLTGLCAEKISNMICDGLYIFDDSGIFACDENGNINKLDFEGNVIDTLLEVR